jgi:hypothetical protein
MARISKVSQSNPVRLPNKAITERPAFHGPMRFTHQPFQREVLLKTFQFLSTFESNHLSTKLARDLMDFSRSSGDANWDCSAKRTILSKLSPDPPLKILQTRYLCFFCNKKAGKYLVALYLFVKVLYVFNAIGQVFLLNAFLSTSFNFYGFEFLQNLNSDRPWRFAPWSVAIQIL